MIVLLIIGGLSFIIVAIWGNEAIDRVGESDGLHGFLSIACLFTLSLGLMIAGGNIQKGPSYNDGQIDALKGIQTHEIQYVFPKGDTIPSDTLYVKIK